MLSSAMTCKQTPGQRQESNGVLRCLAYAKVPDQCESAQDGTYAQWHRQVISGKDRRETPHPYHQGS